MATIEKRIAEKLMIAAGLEIYDDEVKQSAENIEMG